MASFSREECAPSRPLVGYSAPSGLWGGRSSPGKGVPALQLASSAL